MVVAFAVVLLLSFTQVPPAAVPPERAAAGAAAPYVSASFTEELARTATAHARAGEHASAATHWLALLAARPTDSDAHLGLARAFDAQRVARSRRAGGDGGGSAAERAAGAVASAADVEALCSQALILASNASAPHALRALFALGAAVETSGSRNSSAAEAAAQYTEALELGAGAVGASHYMGPPGSVPRATVAAARAQLESEHTTDHLLLRLGLRHIRVAVPAIHAARLARGVAGVLDGQAYIFETVVMQYATQLLQFAVPKLSLLRARLLRHAAVQPRDEHGGGGGRSGGGGLSVLGKGGINLGMSAAALEAVGRALAHPALQVLTDLT